MSPSRPYRDADGNTLTDYPRPSVAVDTAVLTVPDGADTVHVLLVRRAGSHEKGAWALPGTFLHAGETLADAALRSLRDKAGVQGLAPHQLHVFDDPHRDDRARVLSVAHMDVVAWPRLAPAVADRDDVNFVAVSEAQGLSFDHDAIVSMALAAMRDRYRDQPDPLRLLPSPFTLHELRLLHEAVLGQALLKDTFRRHMQPQLKATTDYREGIVGKPARLFRHAPIAPASRR